MCSTAIEVWEAKCFASTARHRTSWCLPSQFLGKQIKAGAFKPLGFAVTETGHLDPDSAQGPGGTMNPGNQYAFP